MRGREGRSTSAGFAVIMALMIAAAHFSSALRFCILGCFPAALMNLERASGDTKWRRLTEGGIAVAAVGLRARSRIAEHPKPNTPHKQKRSGVRQGWGGLSPSPHPLPNPRT